MTDDRITDQDVDKLCREGSIADIEAVVDLLVKRKQGIERQLATSRGDMQEVRSDLISRGVDPRRAQMQATGTQDQAWRARAVGALKFCDGHIGTLRSRLRILRAEENRGPLGPRGPKEAKAVVRKTVVFKGSAEQIAEQLDVYIQQDWWVHTSIGLEDGVIVVLRREE